LEGDYDTTDATSPRKDFAFKQWRNPTKTFDSSENSQELFNLSEVGVHHKQAIDKPITSRGEEIFESEAGSTLKSQESPITNPDPESSSSSESESESDQEKFRDPKGLKPTSAASHGKKAKLKGQKNS
jgi:hypothetical protein